MLMAIGSDGTLTPATSRGRATCPGCAAPVIGKDGGLVVAHWAHEADTGCTWQAGRESVWHYKWKYAAPPERREVKIGNHCADIVAADGVVCELQHSGITAHTIKAREEHYGNMRWIFDATDKNVDLDQTATGWRFHRSTAWPTIAYAAGHRRVMLDLGESGVFSIHWVNETGSAGFGYLYAEETVRMWIAGPDYPAGWDPKMSFKSEAERVSVAPTARANERYVRRPRQTSRSNPRELGQNGHELRG